MTIARRADPSKEEFDPQILERLKLMREWRDGVMRLGKNTHVRGIAEIEFKALDYVIEYVEKHS